MIDITEKYGKDVFDLICKIDDFIKKGLEHRSFGQGVYAKDSGFKMTGIMDYGSFYVQFPESAPVSLAVIDLNSGEYFFESFEILGKKLNIYALDDFNIERVIKRAEAEWAMDSQENV
jgi:hypothetical protein